MNGQIFAKGAGTLDARLAAGLAKVALGTRAKLAEDAAASGLSAVQAQILSTLAAGESGMGALSSRLGLTASTVSESVGFLERRRLVERTKSGRRVTVRATKKGAAHGRRLAVWADFLVDAVAPMTEEEKTVLLRAVLRIIRGLIERGVVQDARMCVTCEHFRPRVHDGDKPHHCDLADVAFGDALLRLDCPDQRPADERLVPLRWKAVLTVSS